MIFVRNLKKTVTKHVPLKTSLGKFISAIFIPALLGWLRVKHDTDCHNCYRTIEKGGEKWKSGGHRPNKRIIGILRRVSEYCSSVFSVT